MARLRAAAWFLVLLGPTCRHACAEEVSVPVRVDLGYVQETLLRQAFTDAAQTARVWDDRKGCNYLVLSNPRVDAVEGRLRITSDGIARIGTTIGEHCLNLIDWKGTVEVDEVPFLEDGGALVRFRVVDSRIFEPDGSKRLATGRLWDVVKRYVHPRLASLSIDLRPTLDQLGRVLPAVFPRADAAQIEALLGSLSFVDASVTDADIALTLVIQPPARAGPAPAPEPALTPVQLQRMNALLEQWDAFLTNIVMHSAADTQLRDLRLALLGVLLDARNELVAALEQPRADGTDTVRLLFVRAWEALAPVMRAIGDRLPEGAALGYISFVSAADALRAIDALGPRVDLELSANGLRRLARILIPDETVDPLRYSLEVDPAMRDLFGFGAPLPPPREGAPPESGAWRFLSPAWAGTEPQDEIARRLNGWVPQADELDGYLNRVRELLKLVAGTALAGDKLNPSYHAMYRDMVLATAWQESCWRQFVREGGKIRPIASGTGSYGIMQVNEKVWRGFYDTKGLRFDIGYNARAGSEILIHYLVDYAIKKNEHEESGDVENLARATYAMYNGGPGHMRRYRLKDTPKSQELIDASFWEKYLTIKAGKELAVKRCFGKGGAAGTGKDASVKRPPPVARAALPRTRPASPRNKTAGGMDSPSGGAWVLAQDPAHYTVQLLAARSEPAVKAFLRNHRIESRATCYRFSRDRDTWFGVLYGTYATRPAAEHAARSLPASLKGVKPWIRPFGDIQPLVAR
jgi:hypothetical protein